jgi:HK97 gp10 family phage protein
MKMDDQPTDPQALRELANSAGPQEEAHKCVKAIQRDARTLAPKKTGNLSRHIAIEEITDLDTGVEGYAVGWDDKAFYGWMVENGTERTAAQPHLIPAGIKNGAIDAGGDL